MIAAAEEAYRRALALDHAKVSPVAAYNLGCVLERQGKVTAATEAYRQAMAFDHAGESQAAAYNLANILKQQGKPEVAEEAYRQAMTSTDADVVDAATLNLGILLVEQGKPEAAQEAYRQALLSGDTQVASMAATAMEELGYRIPNPDTLSPSSTRPQRPSIRPLPRVIVFAVFILAFGVGLILALILEPLGGAISVAWKALDVPPDDLRGWTSVLTGASLLGLAAIIYLMRLQGSGGVLKDKPRLAALFFAVLGVASISAGFLAVADYHAALDALIWLDKGWELLSNVRDSSFATLVEIAVQRNPLLSLRFNCVGGEGCVNLSVSA